MGRSGRWVAGAAALALAAPALAALVERKPPYFASLPAKEARMRSGPGRSYPVVWVYRRAGLPVRVVANFREKGGGAAWSKVADPGGEQGWVLASLVSETRTAIITGDVTSLREQPGERSKGRWRAEPGVVGRISQCRAGWCWFDVRGRGGFVPIERLWGVDPAETLN